MRRALLVTGYAVAALTAWLALGFLAVVRNVGSAPTFAAPRLATEALLLLAPALIFVPLARRLRAPLYEAESVIGWAGFGYVLLFVGPRTAPSLTEFLVFLLPLTVALASLCTLVAYGVGLRVYLDDPRARDFVRARRQGYLGALTIVALGLLHGIGVLTPAGAALLLGIGVLAEVIMQSAWRTAAGRLPDWSARQER